MDIPYTLKFQPMNETDRVKAMEIALDSVWSVQHTHSGHESDGWVRHSRIKLSFGSVEFLIRHYQTKEERWRTWVEIAQKEGECVIIHCSSKNDLELIWGTMNSNGFKGVIVREGSLVFSHADIVSA